MKIIILNGLSGSGKSTLARSLRDQIYWGQPSEGRVSILSISDILQEMAIPLFGLSHSDFQHGRKDKPVFGMDRRLLTCLAYGDVPRRILGHLNNFVEDAYGKGALAKVLCEQLRALGRGVYILDGIGTPEDGYEILKNYGRESITQVWVRRKNVVPSPLDYRRLWLFEGETEPDYRIDNDGSLADLSDHAEKLAKTVMAEGPQ